MIKNKYGYLSEDGREFIISDPRTPRPWFNYIWNDRYAGLISHGGGGFSFLETPRDNRISRMRYNCLPWDRPGRYVMLRDMESGQFWSLSWAPTIDRDYDHYEARIGQGYTTIVTQFDEIRSEITYFVPRDNPCEIWKVKVENMANRSRKLQVFSFQELMMGNALNDIINQPNDKHFTDIKFNKDYQTLEATRRYWVLQKKSASVEQPNIAWEYKLFFSMNLPVKGFDGSLDQFIGKWRSEANPITVEMGKMNNSEITAGDPVVALQSDIELESGQIQNFGVFLGIAEKKEEKPYEAIQLENYRDNTFIERKLQEVRDYWSHYLSYVRVESPDLKFNAMINVWNAYQSAVTFDMARNAGYYHGGLLFGTGIRDQFQDILGMVIVDPSRVRTRILNALRFQFADGSTLHNFFKLTDHGERTHHSDTPLWIPFGLMEYLNETHDFFILDEVVPFYDQGEDTVFTHMVKALDFAIQDTTERGLPRIRKGDWNDTLDHIGPKGYGETIWGAFFLCYALKKTFELLDHRGDQEIKNRWQMAYDRISHWVNEIAWDGQWYVRAFRDNGEVVGSSSSKQGKLFLNAQSWSVISEVATPERAKAALESCLKYLENPTGMQLVWPAYREVDDTIGLISRCVPGKKENGAVFNHASAWFVLAALMNGKVEDAWRIYEKMLPWNSSEAFGIDRYEAEPYVFSEYVTSCEHETEGQASHSWLTGTSVWMFRIGIDWILGLRTGLKGLRFDPRIPSFWDKVRITRKYRGKTLEITILNPDKMNTGVKKVEINGMPFKENWLDVNQFPEKILEILIQMGSH